MRRYAYERKQFGKPVGDFQGMGFQFADVATEIEAARLMTYNAARLKEEGRPFFIQAAMAKYYASNVAAKASGMAIEWAGGMGFVRETGLEKYWRDSKVRGRVCLLLRFRHICTEACKRLICRLARFTRELPTCSWRLLRNTFVSVSLGRTVPDLQASSTLRNS